MALKMYAARRLNVKQEDNVSEDKRYSVQITYGGKPVSGIQFARISTVEEQVMEWSNAPHIHGWFVDKVLNGKDDGVEHRVSNWDLRKLLEVCEKVLNASQLVWDPAYKLADRIGDRQKMETRGVPSKVIKNSSVARRLLPIWRDSGYRQDFLDYGEAYLKGVEATRDWAERMLLDVDSGVRGDIYYRSSGW